MSIIHLCDLYGKKYDVSREIEKLYSPEFKCRDKQCNMQYNKAYIAYYADKHNKAIKIL